MNKLRKILILWLIGETPVMVNMDIASSFTTAFASTGSKWPPDTLVECNTFNTATERKYLLEPRQESTKSDGTLILS